MKSNFENVLGPTPSLNDGLQSFVNLLSLASDAFVRHGVKVLLSGSLADGSLADPSLTRNILDIDLMCIPKRLTISERDQREMFCDVPSAPGFIWLRVPEPARVKDLVRKGKHPKMRLVSLKKVRNGQGSVGHYLVGNNVEVPSSEAKVGVNIFDELLREVSRGDLLLPIFGPFGVFFKSSGKERGAAAFTSETCARLPQTEGELTRFIFNSLSGLVEGIVENVILI